MEPIAGSIIAALAQIPEPYRSYVLNALLIISAVSIALAPCKWLVDRYVPAQWRPWTDGLFRVLDYVAVNTRPLHERPTRKERLP